MNMNAEVEKGIRSDGSEAVQERPVHLRAMVSVFARGGESGFSDEEEHERLEEGWRCRFRGGGGSREARRRDREEADKLASIF